MVGRSIHEFLARDAQPSSFQIYEDLMREELEDSRDAKRDTAEKRPLKILVRDSIREKHAERSARVTKTSKTK
jgi:hypothetical protein